MKMNNVYQIIIFLPFMTGSSAFCPDKCSCDDDTLETTCIETKLEVTYFIHNFNILSTL